MASGRAEIVRRVAPTIVTLSVVAVLGVYLYEQRAHVAENYTFRLRALLAIAGLVVVSLALRGWANQRLFEGLGVRAPFRDWFALVTVNAFTNYLPLSAGMLAKAFYLRRVHGMAYRDFAVGQLALLLLIFGTCGVVGLVTLALWHPHQAGWIAVGFVGMVAAGGVLFLPMRAMRRVTGRWLAWEPATIAGVRRSSAGVMATQVGGMLATAMCLDFGFSMGPVEVDFAACVIFGAAVVLTRLVSIIPGAVGVREFFVGGLAVLTGFELHDAVIAATVVRIAEMAVIVSLGVVFTYTLSGRIASTYEGDNGAE